MSEPRVASPCPSPCIDVCRLDASGTLCTGCWRTLDEIAAWRDLDEDGRRVVLACVAARRPKRA